MGGRLVPFPLATANVEREHFPKTLSFLGRVQLSGGEVKKHLEDCPWNVLTRDGKDLVHLASS